MRNRWPIRCSPRYQARSLLIADRWRAGSDAQRTAKTFAAHAESLFGPSAAKLSVRVQSVHADGSAEVVVSLRERESPCADSSTTAPSKADEKQTPEANKARGRPRKHPPMRQSELPVREIVGRVRNAAGEWVKVRLWTSLSVQQGSARELLTLYAKRWEQEVFYKELKLVLHGGHLLSAQRTETAQQELAALLIASSLVAEERLACAQSSEDEEVRQGRSAAHQHEPLFGAHRSAATGAGGSAGPHGRGGTRSAGAPSARANRPSRVASATKT
ncbi:MAG: hypothetical protein IPK32_21275 [Verrucomicrobiaceae bacterium]|nr:hypothetical protein [Verrucomicrobiaceae bacterium]